MELVELKNLSPEQLTAFADSRNLTPEEKAEFVRLYWAQVSEADLQEYTAWASASPVDDFLAELKEEQRKWDEQHK